MRLYSRKQDRVFNEAVIYFTDEELQELSKALSEKKLDKGETVSIAGTDKNGLLSKKLIIKTYDENNLEDFEDRIKKVIQENK